MKQARPKWFLPVFRLLAICLTGVAMSLPATLPDVRPAHAQEQVQQDDARKQLERSQSDLEAAREREKKLSGDLEKIAQDRAALNANLIETARLIQQSESRLSQVEERLGVLSKQEDVVRGSIAERYGSIAKMLGAMQRMGRQPPPALVTRRDDALQMVRSAMLMASVFPELKSQADVLTAELDKLVKLGNQIKIQRDNLKSENEKLIVARSRISGLITQKKELEAANRAKLGDVRVAAAQHAKTVTYLGELVQRMDKEIAAAGLAQYEAELAAKRARERAAEEAARREGRSMVELKPAETTKVAFVNPGRLKPAIEFGDAKGKLAQPVSGQVFRPFGGANSLGEKAKGISISSRGAAQVTAPMDGWVAFADEFRTYGQLLIINAGGGYHILLAGMERIDVSVGQFILAGEPVAVMGASGKKSGDSSDEQGPVLYVEFRKDGQPIDPGPWWAKSPERVEG